MKLYEHTYLFMEADGTIGCWTSSPITPAIFVEDILFSHQDPGSCSVYATVTR